MIAKNLLPVSYQTDLQLFLQLPGARWCFALLASGYAGQSSNLCADAAT